MNKSPGNKIPQKRHRLLHYTDNTYQNLANYEVDTFFSNHVLKILAFMPKKELGPIPARNSSLK
jgi:hypothetical protein